MKSYLLILALGLCNMAQAEEPKLKNIYNIAQTMPWSTYPDTFQSFATTFDNQAYVADMNGTIISREERNKINPHFGVYLVPMDQDLVKRLEKANSLLANTKHMSELFSYRSSKELGYTINRGGKKYSNGISLTLEGDYTTDFRKKTLSKEEKDFEETVYTIGSALRDVKDINTKDKKPFSTMKITYALQDTVAGLKVDVQVHSIGGAQLSIANPALWKELKDGEDKMAFAQWMTFSYGGVYKDDSYSLKLFLLPKYLDKKSLTKSELETEGFVVVEPNSTRTLNFVIPYKDISFYSAKDKAYLAWNKGNRDAQGKILFDHAALQGAWYLNTFISLFNRYVYHDGEELTQIK